MAEPAPAAFDLVVPRRQSGELREDVIERRPGGLGWLDAEISDSFPASDPLSHWAGPPRHLDEADRAHGVPVRRPAVTEDPAGARVGP
jgi:hypothetical protein